MYVPRTLPKIDMAAIEIMNSPESVARMKTFAGYPSQAEMYEQALNPLIPNFEFHMKEKHFTWTD